jgi:hypothetical protein
MDGLRVPQPHRSHKTSLYYSRPTIHAPFSVTAERPRPRPVAPHSQEKNVFL